MTRRTVLSSFIALVILTIAALAGGASTARAQQNPNCCTYTVDIQGVPALCFPLRVYTQWSCFATPLVNNYTGNGVYIAPIPGLVPCPPASCKLTGVSLDGVNFIPPNTTKRFLIGNCCYVISFGYDINGCCYIKIGPC